MWRTGGQEFATKSPTTKHAMSRSPCISKAVALNSRGPADPWASSAPRHGSPPFALDGYPCGGAPGFGVLIVSRRGHDKAMLRPCCGILSGVPEPSCTI